MSMIADDLLLEQALKAEEYLHETRTRLDGKASSVYAAVAVLAVQPSVLLLVADVTLVVIVVQGLGYGCMVLALYYAYQALDLSAFPIPSCENNRKSREEAVAAKPEGASEEQLHARVLASILLGVENRVKIAGASNAQKARRIDKAFCWLLWALIANVSALIVHLVCRHLGFKYLLQL